MTESDVAALCDALARAMGYEAESYSDTRKVRTYPGLPDRRYVNRGRGVRIWVELKAPGGKMSEAQHHWLIAELDAGGLATVIDDVAQLEALLHLLARSGSIIHAEAHRKCVEWVRLIAKRGYRRRVA